MVQVVEQVNGLIAELIKQEALQEHKDQYDAYVEQKEQELFFMPEKGNVAFSSAFDCWSFTLPSFMPFLAKMPGFAGVQPRKLVKFMWGQYYWNAKKKEPSKKPVGNNYDEMFV